MCIRSFGETIRMYVILLLSAAIVLFHASPCVAAVIPPAPGRFVDMPPSTDHGRPKIFVVDGIPKVAWPFYDPVSEERRLMFYDGVDVMLVPSAPSGFGEYFVTVEGDWIAWSTDNSGRVQLWSQAQESALVLSTTGWKASMDGGTVAWGEAGADRFKVYRQQTGTFTTVDLPTSTSLQGIRVTGDLVYFTTYSPAERGIYVFDGISTIKVDSTTRWNDDVWAVDGGNILYLKPESSSTDAVYMWSYDTGESRVVCDTGNFKYNLRFRDGKAIWIDWTWGSLKLYYYDGVSCSEIISPDGRSALHDGSKVEMHDGLIVWDLYRGWGWHEIMLYDLARGQMYRVTDDDISDSGAQVHSGWIAWYTLEGIRLFEYVPLPLIGDLNLDGVIDFADLVILSSKYGLMQYHVEFEGVFDLNDDGMVDLYDLVMLARMI